MFALFGLWDYTFTHLKVLIPNVFRHSHMLILLTLFDSIVFLHTEKKTSFTNLKHCHSEFATGCCIIFCCLLSHFRFTWGLFPSLYAPLVDKLRTRVQFLPVWNVLIHIVLTHVVFAQCNQLCFNIVVLLRYWGLLRMLFTVLSKEKRSCGYVADSRKAHYLLH